ncbi:MAG: hypothetical protein C4527_08650 [Candidatus Omnitrophota bacterium]|jgi:hypothetical protein|nr:MAG: hypothetical protein C4527_08650 [Candidatus Omnitrophota bacterium]
MIYRLQKYILALLILFGAANLVGKTIEKIEIIDLDQSALFEEEPITTGYLTGIYYLQFTDHETINIISLRLYQSLGPYGNRLDIFHNKQSFLHLPLKEVLSSQETNWVFKVGELICDATSVMIKDHYLELENAYEISSDGFSGHLLEHAKLSPDLKYIGGTMYYYRYGTGGYVPGIWNSDNGSMLFQEDSHPEQHTSDYVIPSIELKFSPDSKYFVVRGLTQPPSSGRKFSFPVAEMINLETHKFLNVDNDVAFTSDGRFFVTEREGMPTLVDAIWDYNWQRYDIGEDIMTAATFSPDDERLYIATDQNRIFVFESRLPAACFEEWELFE